MVLKGSGKVDQTRAPWVDQLVTASAEAALDKMVLTSMPIAEAAERGLAAALADSDRVLSDGDRLQLRELITGRIQEDLYAKRSFKAVTNGKGRIEQL